jgi:parallel beta-helix repeat protein
MAAGMYVESARGTITGCHIYSNTAERGGGMYLAYSSVTLDGNTVTTNTATAADVYDGGGGCTCTIAPPRSTATLS